jgi:hypothetical protein
MPLQNRVTPFGDIVALPGRGLLMGNRGILHDDARHIVRHSQVRRWIACRTDFKNVRRTLMRPHSWTELFFLDEATAFSAGHRPCAECRRADYRRFKSLWVECFGGPVSAEIIDRVLHAERLGGRKKRTYSSDLAVLPDGAYIVDAGFWLVWGAELLAWSGDGYTGRRPRLPNREVDVLTPRSIIAILAGGYRPGIHPSANASAIRDSHLDSRTGR